MRSLFYPHIKDIDPKVIFEFGSYDLADGIRYRELWPEAEIYCFEPDPELCDACLITALEKNINLSSYAISNKNDTAAFYPSRSHYDAPGPSGSLLKHTEYHKAIQKNLQSFPDPIEVRSITIKEFCDMFSIQDIDFMHIDVEGAVLKVLDGFGLLRPKMMRVEVNGRDVLFENAPSGEQIHGVLEQMGYKIKAEKDVDILYEYGN